MVFGESAGAVSVATHVMNMSSTIIKGAIIESNPYGLPIRETTTWGALPAIFKNLLGCNVLAPGEVQKRCLMQADALDILKAQDISEVRILNEARHALDVCDFLSLFLSLCFFCYLSVCVGFSVHVEVGQV